MLSLERQNSYRAKYKAIRPGWRTSGEIYESLVRYAITQLIQKNIGNARVLDLGCGAGGAVELISRKVQLCVGVDQDFPSLLRHRDRATRRLAGSLEHLPFQDHLFDVVLASWVLEHLAWPDVVFYEIARVLKEGGHFIFLTPNACNLVTTINRLIPHTLQAQLVQMLYGRAEADTFPVQYKANSVKTIDWLAASVRLHRVVVETVSDPTYLAFTDWLFPVSVILEQFTPEQNFVHLVGDYVKSGAG